MKFLIFIASIATASATLATTYHATVPLVKTEYQSQVNHVIDAAPIAMAVPKVFAAPMIARPAIATFAAPLATAKVLSAWDTPRISTFGAPLTDARFLSNTWGAPAISTFGALDYAATKLW